MAFGGKNKRIKKSDENTRPAHRPRVYTEKRSALNVMCNADLLERLREYCRVSGYSQTKVINDLLTEFLDKEGF